MEPILDVKNLNLWYGQTHALRDVSIAIPPHEITAFIGPSGCGKSTFLRTLNRMNDLIPSVRITGEVDFHGQNIYDGAVDPTWLRKRIGMVFQKANPFPMSIYDNIAYGPRTTASAAERSWTKSLSAPCAAQPFGRRSATDSRPAHWACPAGSSSGCALPGLWRWSRIFC